MVIASISLITPTSGTAPEGDEIKNQTYACDDPDHCVILVWLLVGHITSTLSSIAFVIDPAAHYRSYASEDRQNQMSKRTASELSHTYLDYALLG